MFQNIIEKIRIISNLLKSTSSSAAKQVCTL
jgi:hypothetical protein